MLSLKTIILKYFLVCVFLVSPCCVHRDRRPDLTVSVVPSPRFVLFVFSSVLFCSRVLSLAASESARREPSCSPFAGVYAAVRGSPIPWFAGVYAAVRGSPIPRFAGLHPAVRGSSCRRSRIIQPSVPGGWRLHPRLTLARRPASDSMPAGLPLTQCPPACLWFQLARSAADSSSPDCRWLKLAGLPLTHATGRRQGRPTHHCLFHAAVRGPPLFHVLLLRGEGQPAVRGHSARSRLRLPPARRPLPLCGQARRLLPLFVKPADYGIPRRPLPYWQASRPWPYLTRQWPRSF